MRDMMITQLWQQRGKNSKGEEVSDLISRGADVEVGGAACVYIGPCPGDRFYFWVAEDDVRWLTAQQLAGMGFKVTCKIPVLKGK